ncbi:hypothetical protein [Peptoniphilus stercorisuis]|uniref:Selenium binding protein n=1 Tax=Peptoniphilus stercorisuis TaxID=1436965 RepID=A0ABS4KEN1_9FIRM|nr:hypothetical protein [Peptoniphilus stercorisuis]MBP2026210.1 hypothetical protein [Peptoniphilus stercorisuis]
MYEPYTRQVLPSEKYRSLLGSAICVFNSNNSFIIENILNSDSENKYDWHSLIDLPSGNLEKSIKETISKSSNTEISKLFSELINMRNRIVHSFQITDDKNEQLLATKKKDGKQFHITEDVLLDFIKKNEQLSILLHDFRGY